jgi:hypothetical protein
VKPDNAQFVPDFTAKLCMYVYSNFDGFPDDAAAEFFTKTKHSVYFNEIETQANVHTY